MIIVSIIGFSGLFTFSAVFAEDASTFEIDGYHIITNTPNIDAIDIDWDSERLPEFSVNFTEPYTGKFQIQIPKNMPRTMNLDFETTLMMDVSSLSGAEQEEDWNEHIIEKDFKMIDDRVSETESLCYYIITVELSESDYFKIGTGSVASGRWEPVTIQNEECNDLYDELTFQHGSVFPRHGYQPPTILSPLKQHEMGIRFQDIQCRDGLELVGKVPYAYPKCVKPESVEKLVMRGWATTDKTVDLVNPLGYVVAKNNTDFEVLYSLKGATLENIAHDTDSNSVHVSLSDVVGGYMVISLPRDLIDAKMGNDDDDVYFLLIDGLEHMYGEKTTDDSRIITVWFPKDTSDIEIIGTFWI